MLPADVPAGSEIFLTAFWFKDKMQGGPLAQRQQVYIGTPQLKSKAA